MSSNDTAIKADNICKCFRIGLKDEIHDNFAGAVLDFVKSPLKNYQKYRSLYRFDDADLDSGSNSSDSDIIWALRNVSFEVKRGEVVGIVGGNGAGKSTLLKILCKITDPTSGRVEIRGRISSLLEVGTGFHPELTGRENVYLNGTILGMKKREVDRKFDQIVDFSGVARFIDTPVKRYSSGMRLRLAFSVAAHLEPEILLVDEVLAVGDIAFQQKCLGKIRDISGQGCTVLFVSHNMATIQSLCHRGLVLSEGCIVGDTSAIDAVRLYVESFTNSTSQPLADRKDREGDGQLRFTKVWMENSKGNRITKAIAGEQIQFCFEYKASKPIRNVHMALTLRGNDDEPVITCTTLSDKLGLMESMPEKGTLVCVIPKFPLRAARYKMDIIANSNGCIADRVQTAFWFDVIDGDFYGTGKLPKSGKFLVAHNWSLREQNEVVLASEQELQ